MNHVMWNNPATQANRKTLEERGVHILGPDVGSQACGETGAGRMLETGAIAAAVFDLGVSHGEGLLAGRKVVITAGPTRESIDPVRYISNRSSGKMGYAIARAAIAQDAEVTLISGPVDLPEPLGVDVIRVTTAQEMYDATHQVIGGADIFIAAAAVADYRPATVSEQKIKKTREDMTIELIRCPDILASVAALANGPFTVGFAAETHNVDDYAQGKLENKKLDMIIANEVGVDLGFDRDENAVSVFWKDGEKRFPTTDKSALANELVELVVDRYYAAHGANTQPRLTVISTTD
jgi:phosphopantothenoylcysteine decarboxylase/phosphopantothenate--cysteine ligase